MRYKGRLLVIPGIELTNNPRRCTPPPIEPKGRCRIHVNALFTRKYPIYPPEVRPDPIDWREKKSIRRYALYRAALKKTAELDGVAQLNHPTWHWGVNARLGIRLGKAGLKFIEIANVAFGKWNRGSEQTPSTEQLWDQILSQGIRIYGIATDDAHHYYDSGAVRNLGENTYPAGGGFVMVRAPKTPEAIRDAMVRGDFYSSTGVMLAQAMEKHNGQWVVRVDKPDPNLQYTISFVGNNGIVLQQSEGTSASFPAVIKTKRYVRAVVINSLHQAAWIQPQFSD